MKRGVCILIILLMALSAVPVLGEPTMTLAPREAYETNHVSFELNISNFRNSYEITAAKALVEGFEVLSLVDYRGWTESSTGSLAEWTEGSIANNVLLAIFELLAGAPSVSEDTETETSITLVDEDGEEHTYTFPITILNDDTPPELSDIIPPDGGLVKQGKADQPVEVNAQDPETGIKNVTFHWVRCNFEENITPQDRTLRLAEYGGLYRNTIDLSGYLNEQQVCFDFTAFNNGGESSTYEGILTIDGIPPEVTLVSPVDGAIIGLSRNFSFFASDNLATVMSCSMDIDGTEYMTDIEAADMDVVFIPSADVEEGQHTWRMRCADPAGWEGVSATWGYTLDKTPPQIVMTSPENDSIIADSTHLEFEVTDNNQLHKVWFVHDGNETEVEGTFSIDVSSWTEGPSEFAVRAEDSVRNRAEQTYRIIIDRIPPQVEPANPEDGAESDVHVNFTYTVLDNYDDEMDCTIYIDDTGQEQQAAQAGAETSQPKILAVGEYRWKVQCVDDAGNIGESSERQLSVIDLTGPDIAMDNPDVVYRGDPVTISLDVTDISGVDAVTAELRDPDGATQSIPLENLADTYTASVETTLTSTLGIYTLEVYAVDTLNNSNTATDGILLTYKYVIVLDLAPQTAAPGAQVIASGMALYDNGSAVPEDSLELHLPGDTTEQITLDEGGAFSHAFTAPLQDGSYDMTASITSEENGITYVGAEQLTVATPQPQHSGGGGRGGGSSHTQTVSGGAGCNTEWSCTAWDPCSGGWQSRTCIDLNHCSSDDARKVERRSCTEKEEQEEEADDESDKSGETSTVSASREPLPGPEEHTVDATEEDKGDAAGIGKAAGFMSSLDVSLINVIFALILMTVLVGTLYRYGWSKGDRRRRPAAVDILGSRGGDRLGLESYLEQRQSRRDRF
ncbi:hypothetical protein JW898_01840 [Candidatus Woesearchaeota archaeon]|nr:hypothetical protein [Candidatus Woesearchaeota archaeon]